MTTPNNMGPEPPFAVLTRRLCEELKMWEGVRLELKVVGERNDSEVSAVKASLEHLAGLIVSIAPTITGGLQTTNQPDEVGRPTNLIAAANLARVLQQVQQLLQSESLPEMQKGLWEARTRVESLAQVVTLQLEEELRDVGRELEKAAKAKHP